METIMQQHVSAAAMELTQTREGGLFSKFMQWADAQECNRFGWLAGILAVHGCVVTPIVVLLVALAGMNLWLFVITMVAMGICLVTNLAAMPTRATIPAFILSMFIDLGVVLACIYIMV